MKYDRLANRNVAMMVGVIMIGWMLAGSSATAQDPKPTEPPAAKQPEAKAPAKRAKPRGRLPNYFGDVVTEEQREKIYEIQRPYDTQIAALREQIEELIAERDAAVEAVLSPEQLDEVKKARAAAIQRRKKPSGGSSN